MQALKSLFGFAEIARALDSIPLRVGIIAFEAKIDPGRTVGGLMLYLVLCPDHELTVEPIGPANDPHAFDLLCGKGFYCLLLVAHQAQTPNATAISEGDVFPIRVQFPAGLLVFY